MDKNRTLLLLLASVALSLVLLEIGARIVVPGLSEQQFADEDYWWRRAWVKRHRLLGREVYYAFDLFDATKGWVPKPNLSNMVVFGNKVLNTNSKGLRGKTEYSYEPDKTKTRILIVGDSFTFGDEVSDDETFSYYLQTTLPQTEVINLGVHGYGHDQMLVYLREEGIRYRPDIVILGFVSMDMSRNMLGFRDFAKPKFILTGGELNLVGYPLPRPAEVMRWDWLRPRTIDLVALARYRIRVRTGAYSKEKNAVTTALLKAVAARSRAAGATPVFAYLPAGKEVLPGPDLTPGEQYLFATCQQIGAVSCFSTRPRFVERSHRGVRFKMVGHWSSTGHETVAEAIRDHLLAHKYVARATDHSGGPNDAGPR